VVPTPSSNGSGRDEEIGFRRAGARDHLPPNGSRDHQPRRPATAELREGIDSPFESVLRVYKAYVERPAPEDGCRKGKRRVSDPEPKRRFVFMVFHWPEPGRRESLAASMRDMRERLLATPGCVDVAPPYAGDVEGDCLVGMSTWESKEAFDAADIPRRPPEIVEGETRPRQRFFLQEILPT
jgi:hypothetical protein